MLQVKDVLSEAAPMLSPDMSLVQALESIVSSGLTGLAVVDKDHHLLGFVSEHDSLPFLIDGSYYCDSRTLVSEVMQSDVLTVGLNSSLVDLAQQMQQQKPKVYPVIDEGKVIGIVSRGMIIKALTESLQQCRASA